MGLRFKSQSHGQCFFVTTSFREHQDFGNIPGFYAELGKSIDYCSQKYRASLVGYVFMPTHIHILLAIDGRHLADFMRDFKKFIAQKASKELRLGTRNIWMSRYDRVVVDSYDVLITKLNYIHENPVRKGLSSQPEQWEWSSARDYGSDEPGPLPIWKDWL